MLKTSVNRLNLETDLPPSEPTICYTSYVILQKSLSIYSLNSPEHQGAGMEQEGEQVTRCIWSPHPVPLPQLLH